ncbi:MAG: glycosyltransferase [Candidatus Saccharimonadales bacterium]
MALLEIHERRGIDEPADLWQPNLGPIEQEVCLAPLANLGELAASDGKIAAQFATAITTEEAKSSGRDQEVFRVSRNSETYEANVESGLTLKDYKSITRPEDWDYLLGQAETLQGKGVVFINPTMEGGGVAMMRPPLVHLLKSLGVDARWYVMNGPGDPEAANPFLFTKLMHNITQRRTPPDVHISEDGKATHQEWNAENSPVLEAQPPIQNADYIIIDDPQPTPLIAGLKQANPSAKFVWRNHIDNDGELMMDPTTPQGEVWQYLRDDCHVSQVDAAVFHPVEDFVPADIKEKTFFMPATVEPHDDLNKPLEQAEINSGIEFINREIAIKNGELIAEGRLDDIQSLLDLNRRRITLVARFDESKGMDKAMALGMRARQMMRETGLEDDELPEVVIVGNGSVDDPSGIPMYEKMLENRRVNYNDDKEHVLVMRLKHNYAAMNALMRVSDIGMQTSEAEGCETRITDWIEHGVPVVVSNRGGMPLQIVEGQSGHIIDFDQPDFDIESGAEFINQLLTDPEKYASMSASTRELGHKFNSREFTTTANATRWLRIFNALEAGDPADKTWQVGQLVADSYQQKAA